ncbi:MAG: PAS domain-containing protein, partial [Gammaproteobacteria bacterium]
MDKLSQRVPRPPRATLIPWGGTRRMPLALLAMAVPLGLLLHSLAMPWLPPAGALALLGAAFAHGGGLIAALALVAAWRARNDLRALPASTRGGVGVTVTGNGNDDIRSGCSRSPGAGCRPGTTEHQRRALHQLLTAVPVGEHFAIIAQAIAAACAARAGAVLLFERGGAEVRTCGHWSAAMAAPPASYAAAGTCAAQQRARAAPVWLEGALAARFPADPLLDAAVTSVLLVPLGDEAGSVWGALCVIDARQRPADDDVLLAIAARCAAIERARTRDSSARETQQAWLELVVNGANAGVWDWNLATDEVRFNDRWARMLGRELADLAPHVATWRALVHPDDHDRVMDAVGAHLAGRVDSYESEHRLRHADGTWCWILDRGMVTERDAEGRPLRMSGMHLDISAAREEQALIRAEQARFARVLEHTPVGLWEWNLEDDSLRVSAPWLARFGFAADTAPTTATAWRRLIHPDDLPRVLALKEGRRAGSDEPYLVEYRLATASNGWRWILSRANVSATRADGSARCLSGVHIDIHAQRTVQDALNEQQRRLELIIAVAAIGLWEWDIPSGAFTVNAELAAMLGCTPSALTDVAAWKAICHPDELPTIMDRLERHFAGETPFIEMEARARRADGEWLWMLSRSHVAARDSAGRPLRMLGLQLDITARKRAEAALVESE